MCKAVEYVYTQCGHKHVKRTPCRFLVKLTGRDGVETTRCKSAYLQLIEDEVGGENEARLKGGCMTISFDKACAPCAKDEMLKRKERKVAAVKEKYGNFPVWSLYSQTKIESAEAEYDRLKAQLDRNVTLTRPKGTYDNEARLPCKVAKRSAKEKKSRPKFGDFLRRRRQEEQLLGELLALQIDQVEVEEDDEEVEKEEQPKITLVLHPRRTGKGRGTQKGARATVEPRRSGRVSKPTWKLR
ncbi:hypothetical protein M409DRAFT_56637 [Zasmidium cellare ATCC 36951]|uniref:Uncharacterized protein n=1 Tax=Zasmidium cellare ATCC 36951 TaxID=1080233 RepID=A0A6A6CB08_ZASCE|nr:uncharacterized protein M409DRAFT_56637 [Zasmidium cellare ATCC 36951]KAF2164364.1 hypothetical protein M409DRAFT_56637 [Zasmidium cellare ATCC 36951]